MHSAHVRAMWFCGWVQTPRDPNELAHTWTPHSVDWFDFDGDLPRYAEEMGDCAQGADIE